MKIAIASDHAGFNLKAFVLQHLKGHDLLDQGAFSTESVDYPDLAAKVCQLVQTGKAEKGILICGSGVGMSISANKFKGIRAAHVESSFTARLAAEHNQANVLCIGERVTAPHYALVMIETWLGTKFAGERHSKRIQKISEQEERN